MKTLFYIFMAMFWYGLFTGLMGAALISFLVALFVLHSAKRMQAQETAWLSVPDNAKQPPDALALLVKAESECMAYTSCP